MTSCFWALLSLDNFEFLYLPTSISQVEIADGITIGKALISHSLLEFIHPDECSLATADLLNFVRIKTLAGAITRCRLRKISSLVQNDSYNSNIEWRISDVVMYTATNKTILTFFHPSEVGIDNAQTMPFFDEASCYKNEYLFENEVLEISNMLHNCSSPITVNDPIRLFQIYSTSEKRLQVTWPNCLDSTRFSEHFSPDGRNISCENNDLLYNNMRSVREEFFSNTVKQTISITNQEIDRQAHINLSRRDTDCTQHSHSHSILATILDPCGVCQIEKLIIIYGNLTFCSFQITPIDNKLYQQFFSSIPTTIFASSPTRRLSFTNKTYQSQPIHPTPSDNSNEIPIGRKPTIKDILNSQSVESAVTLSAQPNDSKSINNAQNSHSSQSHIPLRVTIKKPDASSDIDSRIAFEVLSSDENKPTAMPKSWKGRFGIVEKKCENCQTSKSPEWRRGSTGHKTLCNACGLRYARLVAKQERQQPKYEESVFKLSVSNRIKNHKPKK